MLDWLFAFASNAIPNRNPTTGYSNPNADLGGGGGGMRTSFRRAGSTSGSRA
jgi:hypothetical protein